MKILVLVVCCEDNIGEYKKLSNTIKKHGVQQEQKMQRYITYGVTIIKR